MSFWKISPIAMDPLFEVWKIASSDTSENLVNWVLWVARKWAKPFVLDTVKEVINDYPVENFEYLPISWDANYLSLSKDLILKDGSQFSSIWTPGGTGALYVWFSFLSKLAEENEDTNYKIIIPESVWWNTLNIAKRGWIEDEMIIRQNDNLDWKFDENYVDWIDTLEWDKLVYLFHATCKNPDWIDPTNEQWDNMAKKIKESWGIVFFDNAYQWFWWTLEEDNYAIKKFEEEWIPMMIAQSFSKNFSLYRQRTWALHISKLNESDENIQPLLNSIVRSTWSNPPALWEYIVSEILSNQFLKAKWEEELSLIRGDILEVRKVLSWIVPWILDRKWMFDNILIFDTPKDEQISNLRDKHIYTANDGRINLWWISIKQAEYIKSILEWNV